MTLSWSLKEPILECPASPFNEFELQKTSRKALLRPSPELIRAPNLQQNANFSADHPERENMDTGRALRTWLRGGIFQVRSALRVTERFCSNHIRLFFPPRILFPVVLHVLESGSS